MVAAVGLGGDCISGGVSVFFFLPRLNSDRFLEVFSSDLDADAGSAGITLAGSPNLSVVVAGVS